MFFFIHISTNIFYIYKETYFLYILYIFHSYLCQEIYFIYIFSLHSIHFYIYEEIERKYISLYIFPLYISLQRNTLYIKKYINVCEETYINIHIKHILNICLNHITLNMFLHRQGIH